MASLDPLSASQDGCRVELLKNPDWQPHPTKLIFFPPGFE
jgi:hypothetical protein